MFEGFKKIDFAEIDSHATKIGEPDLWPLHTLLNEDREKVLKFAETGKWESPQAMQLEYLKTSLFKESHEESTKLRMEVHKDHVAKAAKETDGQVLTVGHCMAFLQIYVIKMKNCQLMCVDEFYQ